MSPDDALGAVRAYILGVARQDADALKQLFDANAHIVGLDEGRLSSVPRDRWIAFVTSSERKGAGKQDYSVLSLTIQDTVATAVVRARFGAFEYTDILSLLAVDGAVRVVGKAYHQHAR